MIAWLAVTVVLAAAVWLVLAERRKAAALEARLEIAARELESLQPAFSRFAPAAVVEDIVTQEIATASEKKDVTILFADLKGFTPLAERLDPAVLVRVLNGYFERMSRAILTHSGHVSKFIGDGILATFGALQSTPGRRTTRSTPHSPCGARSPSTTSRSARTGFRGWHSASAFIAAPSSPA